MVKADVEREAIIYEVFMFSITVPVDASYTVDFQCKYAVVLNPSI